MKIYMAKNDAEARGLHLGTVKEIVIPPPGVHRIVWNTVVVCGVGGWTDEHGRSLVCPYVPGDEIGVKEAWARCLCKQPDCSGFLYRDHLGWNTRASGKHFGAPNMPRKAIRTHLLCLSTEPRQVDGAWVWVCGVKLKEAKE